MVPSGPADFLHLHIVATKAKAPPDFRLLIPITSIKPGQFFDPTCLIAPGEHSFIIKESYVLYREIQQRSAAKILACLDNGEFIVKEPVSQALLHRILDGAFVSDFTAPWVFKLL